MQYKYHDKKSITELNRPPILWTVNVNNMGFATNNEAIKMIDHFIKMGFDVNSVEDTKFNMTALKSAILYKNFELVKALIERGALIRNQNINLDAYLFAERLLQSMKNNPKNSMPIEHENIEKIILFLKEREKNEHSS